MRRATSIAVVALFGALSCIEISGPAPDASTLDMPSGSLRALAGRARHIAFAELGPADRIVVDYSSKGCFHDAALRLEFSGGSSGVVLQSRVLTADSLVISGIPARKLRPAELEALDRLLAHYRRAMTLRCTSTDSVHLSLYRSGQLVRQEVYVDEGCDALDPGAMTFPDAVFPEPE